MVLSGLRCPTLVLAKYLVDAEFIQQTTLWVIHFAESNPLLAGPTIVLGTGVIVNTLNDLPSAALIGQSLQQILVENQTAGTADVAHRYTATLGLQDEAATTVRTTILQAVLVGLNIGCYVTPVGALAGIIWFKFKCGSKSGAILVQRIWIKLVSKNNQNTLIL